MSIEGHGIEAGRSGWIPQPPVVTRWAFNTFIGISHKLIARPAINSLLAPQITPQDRPINYGRAPEIGVVHAPGQDRDHTLTF